MEDPFRKQSQKKQQFPEIPGLHINKNQGSQALKGSLPSESPVDGVLMDMGRSDTIHDERGKREWDASCWIHSRKPGFHPQSSEYPEKNTLWTSPDPTHNLTLWPRINPNQPSQLNEPNQTLQGTTSPSVLANGVIIPSSTFYQGLDVGPSSSPRRVESIFLHTNGPWIFKKTANSAV